MGSFGRTVISFVQRRPIVSACVSGFISGTGGDLVAQTYENHKRKDDGLKVLPYNLYRVATVSAFSMFSSVCLFLPFYGFLDKRFGANPTTAGIAAKVIADDVFFVPGVEIPLFFGWSDLANGESNFAPRFERDYKTTALAGWWYNIPITLLNFTVVPPPLRVMFLDVAEFGWITIMSHIGHSHTSSGAVDVFDSLPNPAIHTARCEKDDGNTTANVEPSNGFAALPLII